MSEKLNNLISYIIKNDYGLCLENQSFKEITTLKVGGTIAILYYPNSDDSLYEVIKYINTNNIKYYIIGNGSNILASDKYYDGVIISLKKIVNRFIIDKVDDCKYSVIINSGCTSKRLCDFLLEHSLSGMEAIKNIPATIGGLVAMNASCYDFVCADFVESVEVISVSSNKVERMWISKEKLNFSYRSSEILKKRLIVLNVKVILYKKSYDDIYMRILEMNKKKAAVQPLHYRSAGSTFKNGSDYKAWQVIDSLGLRGFRIKDAGVSNIHTNFLVNLGDAKAHDFILLIDYIKAKAKKQSNIDLQVEWILINF